MGIFRRAPQPPDTTEILADLICAKMLADINAVKRSEWRWPDRPIRVTFDYYDAKRGSANPHVSYDGRTIFPSKKAKGRIEETLRTIFDIQEQQTKSNEHTDNQMRALDAIQSIVT